MDFEKLTKQVWTAHVVVHNVYFLYPFWQEEGILWCFSHHWFAITVTHPIPAPWYTTLSLTAYLLVMPWNAFSKSQIYSSLLKEHHLMTTLLITCGYLFSDFTPRRYFFPCELQARKERCLSSSSKSFKFSNHLLTHYLRPRCHSIAQPFHEFICAPDGPVWQDLPHCYIITYLLFMLGNYSSTGLTTQLTSTVVTRTILCFVLGDMQDSYVLYMFIMSISLF